MKRSKQWARKEAYLKIWRSEDRRRRKPKDKGGSEAVPVEPDNPKLNEGGAAAALEFDE